MFVLKLHSFDRITACTIAPSISSAIHFSLHIVCNCTDRFLFHLFCCHRFVCHSRVLNWQSVRWNKNSNTCFRTRVTYIHHQLAHTRRTLLKCFANVIDILCVAYTCSRVLLLLYIIHKYMNWIFGSIDVIIWFNTMYYYDLIQVSICVNMYLTKYTYNDIYHAK